MGKISSYTEVSSNTTDDVFICNQTEGGNQVTKKTTLAKIASAIFGAKSAANLPLGTTTPTGSTAEAIANCATKAYVDNGTTPTVTITGKTGVGIWNVITTPIVRGGAVNIVMFFEVTGGGGPVVTHNITCTRTISKLDMLAVNLDSTNTVRTGNYDNGTIKFNNTLGNGKYLAIGTLLFT